MLDVGGLLTRIADGDKLAFEILLTTFQSRLLTVAEAVIGEAVAAEDAVQETFVRVLRFAADADSCRDPRAWLFRICVNCARDMRARSLRRRGVPLEAASIHTDTITPIGQLIAQEKYREVTHAIEELSERKRTVLMLRFTADLSYAQIASVLDVPIGTVKSRLHKALARLRRTAEIRNW